ncbi:uncharacterized protein LOC110766231 isoform X2 [Prunus avium]|uniref:Uncharacterized protein LOC110766231 isoform X2 n=1 Tax=Prunus avium TaxID=42229 RepID=A0A6P5TDN8_PRUAV|nr:uncharacterized protein LOC110766231 isoform X2 [Prunus avium]
MEGSRGEEAQKQQEFALASISELASSSSSSSLTPAVARFSAEDGVVELRFQQEAESDARVNVDLQTAQIMQAQMWFGAIGQGKKSFNHDKCWEVVKNCKRFRPMCPTVVLNETPLHDSSASDSPLDSPMSQDSPIKKEPRPIGRKAAKAKVKRGINSSNNTSKFLEEIAKHNAMRIEIDMKTQADERSIQAEYAKEREYVRKENIDKQDRETMAMDTSHMSPETK